MLRAPSGVGFVIETKTARFTRVHAARTISAARRLARRRRRYPGGVVPVLCIVRAHHLQRVEHDALVVVSLDRLLLALRAVAAAECEATVDLAARCCTIARAR